MPLDNERELLKRVRKDPQAFAVIYDQHYNSIFSYIFRRLANYELARDVTAETFLKAYQKIGVFEWRNIPISAWLFRIATNEINLHFRHAKNKHSYLDETNLHLYLPYEEGIETEKAALEKALQENKEFLMIQKQLLRLNIKYQEVIALRYFEEKNIKEISTILSKKQGTVKSLLSRGLEKLRLAIEKPLFSGERLG
ncbi:MAG TPA: RNA polymerase sigma factor [Chitinophagaceae bacterium]|jgi:RNA polymerase sigma-70 factor (ECF subfamily)|nr:RNA polymerase sigma factor [Chitinophagaceae bacterium]